MIDNYDSFTYNLVQYLRMLNQTIVVYRNDDISIKAIKALQPEKIILSPGPGRPEEAGIMIPLIQQMADSTPILGICLGHQAIAQAFGARTIKAKHVMHGKTSDIHHNQKSIFYQIPKKITVTRYHSLIVDPASLTQDFEITAWTEDQEIMAIQHRQRALTGLQFHPESILTKHGYQLLANFLNQTKTPASKKSNTEPNRDPIQPQCLQERPL